MAYLLRALDVGHYPQRDRYGKHIPAMFIVQTVEALRPIQGEECQCAKNHAQAKYQGRPAQSPHAVQTLGGRPFATTEALSDRLGPVQKQLIQERRRRHLATRYPT